jgi:membrane fusion protein (multidrug efflux system)
MSKKRFIVGVVLVLVVGLGVVAFVKWGREPSESSADETAPTIVTVQTGAIKLATLHRYVEAYGTIEPAPATAGEPAAGARLAAPSPGVVTKVNVIEGENVTNGETLVELNSRAAEQELERQKKLYAQQNTSLKNLQDAEAQLALLRVTTPLSGTVVRLKIRPGQAVELTTVVAEVMDLNRLAVSVEIPAAEAGDLKPGDPVEVLTKPPVKTELLFVSPNVDPNSGAVLLRALLPAAGILRPGQFVPLRIVTAVHTNCLAAPRESVVTDESGKSMIALVKGDEAVQTTVQIGLREGDWIEVHAPELKAGDTVVTTGAYGLPEKTKIHIQNASDNETSSTNSPEAK